MNNQIHNFLALLGEVVNEKETSNLISPIDWHEIFKFAKAHNVYALVFDKASEVPAFLEAPEYESCMITAMAQVADQTQRTQAFLELYRAFSEAGLYPIVMKGIVCRQMYREYCDHRPSGDEDILIRKEEYEEIKSMLMSRGYQPKWKEVTASQLTELQEVSFYNANSGLHIEVHTNPIGHENDLRRQMNDYFQAVFDHPSKLDVEGTTLWTMNHTDHFLFLVLHAFKHMMVSGFGIRQVLDILLYEKIYGDKIDWSYINDALSRIGAERFFSDLVYIGNRYLGFQLPAMYEANCPKELLQDLLDNGTFGNKTQAQRTSVHMTEAAVENRGRQSKVRMLCKVIFPGRANMIGGHPELQEKPWLLPIHWVQRWGRFIQHSSNNDGNLVKESMKISQRRIKLLKKYKIIYSKSKN